MSKKIETLVEDIYELLDTSAYAANPKNLEDLGRGVASAIGLSMAQDNTRPPTIRASGIGKACDRQQWYDLKGFEGLPLQPNTRLMFMYGHIVEALLLFLAKEAGHHVGAEQAEVKVGGIKGHIDAIIDGVVVDVKSASTRSFEKFQDGTLKDDDPFGYMKQIGFYSEGLGMRGGFLAMDKQYGHITWLEVPAQPSVRPRIRELQEIEKMEDTPVRSMHYNPKPLGKGGNMTLCTECKYCSHKIHCWTDANEGKGLRAFMYSNGPVFLTTVKSLPKVDEIL